MSSKSLDENIESGSGKKKSVIDRMVDRSVNDNIESFTDDIKSIIREVNLEAKISIPSPKEIFTKV